MNPSMEQNYDNIRTVVPAVSSTVASYQVSIQNAVSSPNDVTFSRPRPLMNAFHMMENENFSSNGSSMSSLMPVSTPPNYTYSKSNEQLTEEATHPYVSKTFMDLDDSNALIYNQNPTLVSSLTGTSVEETQPISTIQNIIAENSCGEVSYLDITPLTAPKIPGLNQKTRIEECDTVQRYQLFNSKYTINKYCRT
uniref:Uncharacterized protein n=1 Tax=Schizaphis graminum TaxID=13262 RepID=A0A2S2PAY1_SCHGA